MAHGDAQQGEVKGKTGRMQRVASTLRTTSEHGVSSITTADAAHLGWPAVDWTDAPHRADLNGLVRFVRKTKSGLCACDVTFQMASTILTYELQSEAAVYISYGLPRAGARTTFCCNFILKAGFLFDITDSIAS